MTSIPPNTPTSYSSATIQKLDKSRIEITGSIPAEVWEKYRTKAISNLNQKITIDGFRKGMIPENILISKIGDMAILEETAEHALSRAYVDIVMDHKLDVIGKPTIHVTKLARGNPLEFKATSAILPEVKLPDYKKIAAKHTGKQNPNDEKFTDEELESTIKRIQTEAARRSPTTSKSTSLDPSEKHNLNNAPDASSVKGETSTVLPELTDDYVRQLGAFSSVQDFREKVGNMLSEHKREQVQEKRRIAMADEIRDATEVELPQILVDSELDRTEAQFRVDIERMGVKLEDYMKHAKKTLEDIRTEWRPHAEKKAKLQLILNAIAHKESISPTPEEVEHEVKHILEHYKDADRERAQIYAETVLTNEKVFQFLEGENE